MKSKATTESLFRKIYNSLEKDGVSITWHKAITSLRYKLFRMEDRKWADQHHLRTLEDEEIDEIGPIKGDNKSHGFRYVASPICLVRTVVQSVIEDLNQNGLDLSDCTFIDYGSGKGQALMVAAEFPFREVIGIEFSQNLHEQAEANLEAFLRNNSKTSNIKSIEADASEFKLPKNITLVYFFNPFSEHVLRKVLRRLEERARQTDSPVYIAYAQAKLEDAEHDTSNMEIIAKLEDTQPLQIKYRSLLDRFLLGSFKISLDKLGPTK